MANKIPIIYESAITAQESAAIIVDNDSTGVLTTIDNSKTGNGKGCHWYKCFVDVTVAPSGDATARLKYAGKSSGTPGNFDIGSLSVSIPSGTTGEIEIGDILNPPLVSQCKLSAEDYGFTASLIVVPMLPEAQ